jgi:hypothetical protein
MMTMIRQVSIDERTTFQHYGISKNIKDNEKKIKTKRKRPPVFPQKLYNLLENAEIEGYDHLIRWSPDGKSFKIHDNGKDTAIVAILKQNFNQTRFKSFLRQLQLYGFERQFTGESRGECSHPMFVRGRKELLHKKSVEEFQDAAANGTTKPTTCPSSSAKQLLSNSCEKEASSSSSSLFLLLSDSAVSSTITEPISFLQHHTNGDANYWQSPTTVTSTSMLVSNQQQQSSFDFITSNIPTRLVNLVLRDCDDDNDDNDDDDTSDSINVFNRNLFDTTTYDDSSISSNNSRSDHEDDDVVDEDANTNANAADDGGLHIATIGDDDYPQWAGSSMELEILKTI